MVFLSVLIPVYNVEKYLKVCVESVLSQVASDCEIILVDDGSTDSSPQICDSFATDPCVRVLHQCNCGLLLARRVGFKLARGKYVLCVDADDYLLPGAIDHIYKSINQTDCDMLVFDYIYGAGQNKPERVIRICPEEKLTFFNDFGIFRFKKQLTSGKNFNSLCCKVVKRSCIDIDFDYEPYSFVSNGEDSFQSFPILDSVKSISYLPMPLYFYRRDNISMSKHFGKKDFFSFLCIYERADLYMKKWAFDNDSIDNARYMYLKQILDIVLQARKECNRNDYLKFLNEVTSSSVFFRMAYGIKMENKYYNTVLFLLRKKCNSLAFVFIDCVNFVKGVS